MKTLRQLCVAVVFTLALAAPAFAGEMPIGSPTPPPSQPQTATVNGEMPIGLTGQEETGSSEATAADSATEAVLNLLQSVLAHF
jgi:hypothetical protein